MSFINKVRAKGLKGISREFELQPLTYIHGPNRSNKTSIIDAIKVALLGYYPAPDVPKTNTGIMRLADASELDVEVGFADGRNIRRSYRLSAGKVAAELSPPDYEVDRHLALCLDNSLYFGKTENERIQQIMNMAQNLGDDDRLPEIISNIKMLRATDHNGRAELVLHSFIKELPPIRGMAVQRWLTEVLLWAKEKYKQTNASLKAFEASNRTLSEANSIDVLQNVDSRHALVKAKEELTAKISHHTQEWGARKDRARAHAKAVADKKLMEDELRKYKLETMPKAELDALRAEEYKWTLEARRLSAEAEKATDTQDAAANESTEANNAAAKLEDKVQTWRDTIRILDSEIEATSRMEIPHPRITEYRNSQASVRTERLKLETQIDQLSATMNAIVEAKCCPTCRAEHSGWKAEALSRYAIDVDAKKKEVTQCTATIGTLDGLIADCHLETDAQRQEKIDQLLVRRKAAEEQIVAAGKKLEEARTTLAKIKAAWSEAGARAKKLRLEAADLVQAAEKRNEVIGEQGNAISMLMHLEKQIAEFTIPPEGSLDAPPEIADLRRQEFEVQAKLDVLNNQQAEQKRIEEIKAVTAEMKAGVELAKKIGETVKDEQAKIVDGAFRPMLEVANALVDGILDSPLVYFEGQIGREGEMPGSFISLSTFSGSELRLTQMAITVALARDAQDKIGIIDETGTFDDDSLDQLIDNVDQMLGSGTLNQVIFVGTVIPKTMPASAKIINTALA